jgi:putative CocE/NonD family hydrolase
MRRISGLSALAGVLFLTAWAVTPGRPQPAEARFDRTEAMVPMRDGIGLFTTVHAPRDAADPLPILLIRTPYGIAGRGERNLRGPLKELADDGYIFVFQDIRGRFQSEGTFVMTRPPRDPADPKAVDEASDTQDTIAWLLKNVKGHNGKVGMLGISYPGWLTAVAMLDPHPALAAVSPQASPVDMFLGDDFHHNGAFRLSYGFEYTAMMETDKTNFSFKFDRHDTYDWYLSLGGLANVNRRHFKRKLPTWNDFVAHPNYDNFWKKQSLEPRLTKVTVPTLNVAGWYDQEDFRGPLRIYELLEKHDTKDRNFLVVGPWNHGGWDSRATGLGRVTWGSDTGRHFRERVQAPFFAYYLKGKGDAPPPEARVFQTGANRWEAYDRWPPKQAVTRKLYLHAGGKLSFDPPAGDGADEYVSDPANPVPYRPRPVRPTYPGREWPEWMVQDQRFTHRRPDVLSYETEPLTEDVVVAGSMTVTLFGATSGTDSDWIARLIDVYPETYEPDPGMGGYQLLIAGEPVRARFRKSYEKPEPVKPDAVEEYVVNLNWGHHRFRRGHRIMVQVSSTWFPVIDRNPQKFVPNIYEAEDEDFRKARQRVFRSAEFPSHVSLQTLPVGAGR